MVDQRALYAVLGLSPGADRAAIRQSYRALARRLHPDVNRSAGAADQMRELNAAYDALRNLPISTPVSPSVRTTSPISTAPVSAAPFSSFAYRTAGASASAVSVGSPHFISVNGVTIGIVAGFVGLVTLFAVWAFAVTKPFAGSGGNAGAGAAVGQSRVAAPAVAQSTTNTRAAQASANAAANAAAARSNLTSTGSRSEVAGVSATHPASAAPTVAAITSTQSAESSAPPPSPAVTQAPETTLAVVPPAAPPVQAQTREVQPAIPAVPAVQPSSAAHISAVGGQSPVATDISVAQVATRALSAHDKSWTAYATALRVTAAGSLASNAINSAPAPSGAARMTAMSPSALLSGEAQLTMARTAHFQQQLAWNTQASAALNAAAAANSTAPRPDLAKAARADQRLRQAADLVSQSSNAGNPLNTTQLKTLLDEAELLHRESVAEWAKLLASLS